MPHVSPRFLAALVLACLLTACVPLPGTKLYSSVLCWQQGDARIERTEWEHSMVAVMSAEGLMAKGKYHHFEYWLHEGEKHTHLRHLSFDPERYLLHDMLELSPGSGVWMAIILKRVERSEVDLELVVFDRRAELFRGTVLRCNRTSTSAALFYSTRAYAITPAPTQGRVVFSTRQGNVVYDVASRRLTPAEATQGKPSL